MRKYGKLDRNHNEICGKLREAGYSVLSLAALGGGVPDILVASGQTRRSILMEIKDWLLAPSERKLTTDEAKFHASWKGIVLVVNSVEEALSAAREYLG